MKPRSRSAASIRRQLFLTLFVPVAAVLIVGTVSDYLTAVPPLTDAYDQALLDSALAIAAHVQTDETGRLELSLPPDALAVLRADSQDSIFFRVSAADGRFIAGDADLPPLALAAGNPAHADAEYRGQPVRLVSYRTLTGNDQLTVTMGETTHKRAQTRNRILTSALVTDVALLSVILALIGLGVHVSLEPLRSVGDQIAQRSARDLTPLAVERVPAEIRRLVSALNRLFGRVSESAARQRQFLDNAAHQLRTPLAGIQAQLELLCADERDTPQRERLQRILDGSRRLGHTTHQLLTLARADESAMPDWQFEDVDLASIVESVVTESIVAAEQAGIDLGADVRTAEMRGIGWLVAEALRSLANNALAHTPAGGSVTLGCGVRGDTAFVEVVDTGVGIPAGERERVLERFFRASNARGTGSGLGLAIVKEVTELHRGALTIEPGPNDIGTAARLTFPRMTEPRTTVSDSVARAPERAAGAAGAAGADGAVAATAAPAGRVVPLPATTSRPPPAAAT